MVRKPAYLQAERGGRERWLISYTDILTLLLILFIAMAAQTLGEQQARAVQVKTQSVANTPPPAAPVAPPSATSAATPPAAPATAPSAPPAAPAPLAAASSTAPAKTESAGQANPSHQALLLAQERLKQHGLDPHMEARGLVISLPQAILFSSGDDRINRSAQPIIAGIAEVLRSLDNKVELAGHADSIPIHTQRFRNNWELSAARGLSLLNTLTTEYGVSESRLTVSSYGSFSPKTSNDTPDGRAENRRVEILILDESQK